MTEAQLTRRFASAYARDFESVHWTAARTELEITFEMKLSDWRRGLRQANRYATRQTPIDPVGLRPVFDRCLRQGLRTRYYEGVCGERLRLGLLTQKKSPATQRVLPGFLIDLRKRL
jgi:hypothetical protein